MANLKYTPVKHDHQAFLAKARARKGFTEAYSSTALQISCSRQGPGLGSPKMQSRNGWALPRVPSLGWRPLASTRLRWPLCSATQRLLAVIFR